MGYRKTKLSWIWPLISLDWLPEILRSLDNLLEPSWVGLQREMIANIVNQSFGRRIFFQLQSLLLETGLIIEDNRYIQSTIKPSRRFIISHLTKLFIISTEPWADYFRIISDQKITLSFADLKKTTPIIWDDIYKYSVFKQWSLFFQYVGLGFLIDKERFIPESAITSKMLYKNIFLEKCIKTYNDPRILTGQHSLHTEADFFAWTKGEDNLPISNDPKLNFRIPYEVLTNNYDTPFKEKIEKAISSWNQQILKPIKKLIPFTLNQLIITYKIFIDYFLFGNRSHELDFLSKEKMLIIKSKWNLVPKFHLSDNIWKSIPKIYNNITRLSFGILYYRNSLSKVINTWDLYNEDLLVEQSTDAIKNLPIRSYYTKRRLSNFMDNIYTINASISKLINAKIDKYYKEDVSRAYEESNNFLPKNMIDIDRIITEASKIIDINNDEISALKQELPHHFLTNCPKHPKLATCFWIHRQIEIAKHPKTRTIKSLKKKLSHIEKKFIIDMAYFKQDMDKWNEACANLKKTIMKFKPIQ